ncbi:extracellular serine-rich protein [Podospora appendiculata]|uniref:Extracellular serine-rich protein n=1 Tax=Podospora appendiculata TaxID=314037 RepID=A0AAE0X9W1_9PEZI|nr:extracellular serine-rich protein [Podospora appendiculata]
MYHSHLVAAAALIAQATAATIRIDAGQGGWKFSPSSAKAAKGDILEFHFNGPTAHDVVAGDFNSPCKPATTGGFYSGIFRESSGENANVFRVTVNSTDPTFFYCSIQGHCQNGMSGVINPSSDQTLATYQSNSQSASSSAPPAPFGGQVVGAGSSSSPSDTTSSSPSSTAASAGNSPSTTGTTTNPSPSASVTGKGGAGTLKVSVAGLLGGVILAALMI